jgi:hypothetical protein
VAAVQQLLSKAVIGQRYDWRLHSIGGGQNNAIDRKTGVGAIGRTKPRSRQSDRVDAILIRPASKSAAAGVDHQAKL